MKNVKLGGGGFHRRFDVDPIEFDSCRDMKTSHAEKEKCIRREATATTTNWGNGGKRTFANMFVAYLLATDRSLGTVSKFGQYVIVRSLRRLCFPLALELPIQW